MSLLGSFLGGRELLQDLHEEWQEPDSQLPQAAEKDLPPLQEAQGVSTQGKANPLKQHTGPEGSR